jgi:hypothetical protein
LVGLDARIFLWIRKLGFESLPRSLEEAAGNSGFSVFRADPIPRRFALRPPAPSAGVLSAVEWWHGEEAFAIWRRQF